MTAQYRDISKHACKCRKVSRIKGKIAIYERPVGGPFGSELANSAGIGEGGGGVLISSGSISWKNDTRTHTLTGTCLMMIMNSDTTANLKFSKDFDGYLFWMSESFIDSLSIDFSRSDLAQTAGNKPCIRTLTNNDSASLTSFLQLISANIEESGNSNQEEVVKMLIKALYYKTFSKMSVIIDDDIHNQKEQLTKDFLQLVRKFGHQHRDLGFYADKMCITCKYLSSAVTKTSGKRAHIWLEQATMNKAKYLLKNTDNQVCIIADNLNFSSPADFVRYFRVREGITPLQYRRMERI